MAKAKEAEELAALFPEPRTVTVAGEAIELRPITVGKLPELTRAVRPMMGAFAGGEPDWMALIEEHGERLIAACAVATGRKREWIAELMPDEFIALCSAVVEVNLDFFVRRMAPAFEGFAARIEALAPTGAGPTPPKRS